MLITISSFWSNSMPGAKLKCYLRTYRKRDGLSQAEVAYLLGCRNNFNISRYEHQTRQPDLKAILAFEYIYKEPVGKIFAGMRDEVIKEVDKRLHFLNQKWFKQGEKSKGKLLASINKKT